MYRTFYFELLFIGSRIIIGLCDKTTIFSEPQNLSNLSDANETYDMVFQNESAAALYNDTFDDFYNVTNKTEEHNLTEVVVTEDWSVDKADEWSRRYLYFTSSDEDICTCDLSWDVCDINCCCDPDCSEEHLKVFSKCQRQVFNPDPNYCYQRDVIFRNNTVYKMVKDPQSSLFCIVHDNLREHRWFKELPLLHSHKDLDVLLHFHSKRISSWSEEEVDLDPHEGSLPTQAGSPIYVDWVLEKKTNEPWSLPYPCFTQTCSCHREIRYLEDFRSHCSRVISNLKEECTHSAFSADNYIRFCIHPRSLSQSLQDLIAHTKNNSHLGQLCVEMNTTRPEYLQNRCTHMVGGLHFTLHHNGFHGILNISVDIHYVNVSEGEASFQQEFGVSFQWNDTGGGEVHAKSGNPGYQMGRPILAGTNGSAGDTEDSFEIKLIYAGLSTMAKGPDSFCSNIRREVHFGKNFKTGCRFKVSHSDCTVVQNSINHLLLGSSKKDVFIGIFGNANRSSIHDWIEAYHEESEVSKSGERCWLNLGLSLHIAYAAVGTTANPQYKILGVGYHYSKARWINCSPHCPDLMLSTSVSFFDVTEGALSHYPKVPSIHVSLPSDFFYPFLSGKESFHLSNMYTVLFICILIQKWYTA